VQVKVELLTVCHRNSMPLHNHATDIVGYAFTPFVTFIRSYKGGQSTYLAVF